MSLEPPEIRIGLAQIVFRGKEAIRAGGRVIRFLLIARGLLVLIRCAAYAAATFWFFHPLLACAAVWLLR